MHETIVIYGQSLAVGGLQRATGIASLALAELGYDPVLVLRDTHLPVHFAHTGRLLRADLGLLEVREAFANARLILDYGWNNLTPGEWRATIHRHLAERYADRLVPTVHSTSTVGQYLDIYRDLGVLSRVPAIVCVSKAVCSSIEARYGLLPNVRILPNAINPELTERTHNDLFLPPHTRPYFLFVGRTNAIKEKGLDHLMASWSAARLGDTHDLILLGDPAPTSELMEIVEREGVFSSVLHQSFVANPAAWMSNATALVLASRHEGLGLVLPEALWFETPCIATRCGGPEEVIQDGVNGFLLDVGDTQGFATAMVRIARDPDLRSRLAACARESAKPFLFSTHVQAWEHLLIDLNIRKKDTEVSTITSKREVNRRPTISIQLPVFNKERYLRECLDSIIAQTYTDFEVLCVDDGSGDGSWDILQEYAAQDSRFRLFRHKTNLGTMAARKRCFQEARGDYMAFADADDTACPEWLFELLNAARRESADFVQCAAKICDPKTILSDTTVERYRKSISTIQPVTFEEEEVFRNCGWPIRNNLWLSFVARSVYCAIIPHIPNDPVPHGNDGLLIFMMAFFSKKYTSISTQLYHYCANETSSNLVTPNSKVTLDHIRSRARIIYLAREFLGRVASNRSPDMTPIGRLENSCRLYTQSLIQRCVEEYPDTKEILDRAYAEHFSLESDSGQSRLPTSTAASPAPKTFLKRLRSAIGRHRAARQLQCSGLFLPQWYLDHYPDVKAAGVNPLKHFLVHGVWEGRDPNPLFDTSWYMSVNPDVASSGSNPLMHYLLYGWREKRSPSLRFNIVEYLRLRPDVAEKGVEPLGHFLIHGIIEGTKQPVPKLATIKLAAPKISKPSPEPIAPSSSELPVRAVNLKVPSSIRSSTLESKTLVRLSEPPNVPTPKPSLPILKLSTVQELADWYHRYPDFIALCKTMGNILDDDYFNAKLKLIQDLAVVDFMTRHLRPGAKILEIGGGRTRLLTYFGDSFESWLLDKFEGVGYGPVKIPTGVSYKIVLDYIGAFSNELPSGYFDFIFSISVFEHIQGDTAAMNAIISDINRLLKPNGLQAHCMDCWFSPSSPYDLPTQFPFINHVIEQSGFKAQYIYNCYHNTNVFTMSAQAYDRFWKETLNNRSYELNGPPFSIFLATGRTLPPLASLSGVKRGDICSSEQASTSSQTSDSKTKGGSTGARQRCNICGSSAFTAAWAGRLNNGIAPSCTKCGSCERHRVIRRACEDMPPTWLIGGELLQFSKDPSIPVEQFKQVEISIFNGKNHLDLQAIDRPDASYDWVVCNHVLEHVPDDRKAMHELLRVVKPKGILLFSYPSPNRFEKTNDWGWPDEKLAYHYRTYGRDAITTRFADAFTNWHVLSYCNIDPVTEASDMCYIATRDLQKFNELRERPHWTVILNNGLLVVDS